jgi:CheY-like chemotaxis protein
MDLQMPNMDGIAAMEVIRKNMHLSTPVIALTANAVDGERVRCIAAGMQGYLSKPFEHKALYEEICRNIQKR